MNGLLPVCSCVNLKIISKILYSIDKFTIYHRLDLICHQRSAGRRGRFESQVEMIVELNEASSSSWFQMKHNGLL